MSAERGAYRGGCRGCGLEVDSDTYGVVSGWLSGHSCPRRRRWYEGPSDPALEAAAAASLEVAQRQPDLFEQLDGVA